MTYSNLLVSSMILIVAIDGDQLMLFSQRPVAPGRRLAPAQRIRQFGVSGEAIFFRHFRHFLHFGDLFGGQSGALGAPLLAVNLAGRLAVAIGGCWRRRWRFPLLARGTRQFRGYLANRGGGGFERHIPIRHIVR